jgi:GNAT superfamily N-acetyltransferase
MLELQNVLSAAPEYSLIVEGKLPSSTAAAELFAELPPGKSYVDKFVFGFLDAKGMVGCAEVIRGYPTEKVAYIGLLLFAESEQGKSFGPYALDMIEPIASAWGCTALRIAAIETNTRALAFWHREGFSELYRKPSSRYTGQAIVMERALSLT